LLRAGRRRYDGLAGTVTGGRSLQPAMAGLFGGGGVIMDSFVRRGRGVRRGLVVRPRRGVGALLLLAAVLLFTRPAEAQMAQPLGIEDINWRATLGTGVALETGGITRRDPFLLYFGAEIRKSWRWWYGLTLVTRGDLYTGLAEYPVVPYKLNATGSLALGPHVFRMEVLRAEFTTDFGPWPDHSTGTLMRFEASTLPTFTGDVPFGETDEHILTYFMVPVQMVIGHYFYGTASRLEHSELQAAHNWRPYPAGKLRGQYRFIATDWIQLHAGMMFLKSYSNSEFRWQLDGGASIGIVENTVQFSLSFLNDLWYSPDEFWLNTATFTLSARLRI
jgi:hypothetical protein